MRGRLVLGLPVLGLLVLGLLVLGLLVLGLLVLGLLVLGPPVPARATSMATASLHWRGDCAARPAPRRW